MRVVVDTSVWVSALITRGGVASGVLEAYRASRFQLVESVELLTELDRVLARPRFIERYQITRDVRRMILRQILSRAELVPITGTFHFCRDPNDDMVIETAAVGRAEVIVTGDHDLKSDSDLARKAADFGVAIVSVREFLKTLESG